MYLERCQICPGDLKLVWDAGKVPLASDYRSNAESYPLLLCKCDTCGLLQLGYEVNSHQLFPANYAYRSGLTPALHRNFEELALKISRYYSLGNILDIGGNDGTCLKKFGPAWTRWLVEPTDASREATGEIALVKEYWPVRLPVQMDVILASNVFAHMPDVNACVAAVAETLKRDGIFVSENHWVGSICGGQWDAVYHEHLRYYGVKQIRELLARHGLKLFRVEHTPVHGGSIRCWAAHEGSEWQVTDSVAECENLEKFFKFEAPPRFAIGAPVRASTLLSVSGLKLEAVVEQDASPKVGKVMPGTAVPIISETAFLAEHADEGAWILAHHISVEVIASMRAKGWRGKAYMPNLQPRVIG